jgi:hypothetical protein
LLAELGEPRRHSSRQRDDGPANLGHLVRRDRREVSFLEGNPKDAIGDVLGPSFGDHAPANLLLEDPPQAVQARLDLHPPDRLLPIVGAVPIGHPLEQSVEVQEAQGSVQKEAARGIGLKPVEHRARQPPQLALSALADRSHDRLEQLVVVQLRDFLRRDIDIELDALGREEEIEERRKDLEMTGCPAHARRESPLEGLPVGPIEVPESLRGDEHLVVRDRDARFPQLVRE